MESSCTTFPTQSSSETAQGSRGMVPNWATFASFHPRSAGSLGSFTSKYAPSPIPWSCSGPVTTASWANLVNKARQPAYCRVENRCPKSRKPGCSCFVFQTFPYEYYDVFNVTLLEWHLPGQKRQPHAAPQSFFFSYLGTRLLTPGILVCSLLFLKHI